MDNRTKDKVIKDLQNKQESCQEKHEAESKLIKIQAETISTLKKQNKNGMTVLGDVRKNLDTTREEHFIALKELEEAKEDMKELANTMEELLQKYGRANEYNQKLFSQLNSAKKAINHLSNLL